MRAYKLIALLLLMTGGPLFAQKKQVTGLVCDEQNVPLIGATVMVKGTQNGTIADVNGTYTLTVKEGDVLQAVFTGYLTEEVTVGKADKVKVGYGVTALNGGKR